MIRRKIFTIRRSETQEGLNKTGKYAEGSKQSQTLSYSSNENCDLQKEEITKMSDDSFMPEERQWRVNVSRNLYC
jgi:hypothetical protein